MTTFAHLGDHGDPVSPDRAWAEWSVDPMLAAALALAAGCYGVLYATQRRHRRSVAVGRMHVVAFAIGLAALALALTSPLDGLSSTLLAGHMAQHVVLVAIAAPLLAYGTPLVRMSGLLGRRPRAAAHRAGRMLRSPPTAGLAVWMALALHAAVVWIWHLPALYERALESGLLHGLQHLTFLLTALLFWWTVLAFGARVQPSVTTLLALLAVGAQGAALGALMAFSSQAWYPAYVSGAAAWDVTPVADQQLAGMLMWGLGGVAPVVAAAILLVGWLDRFERFPRTSAPR